MTPEQAMQLGAPSPQLPKAEVLGFDAAVRRAVARNPSAQIAVEEIARAQALVEQVRAASLPTLTANVSYTRLEGDRTLQTAAGTQLIAAANQYNANLALTVPIIAPQRWLAWAHAKDGIDIARLSAEDVRRQLALATARTYIGIIAQHRIVEVSQRARDTARAHYQFAHQRFAGGYGTRVDEVRAAQEVATDESQLQSAVASLARLREVLGVLVGLDHAVDVNEEPSLPGAPPIEESLHDAVTLRSDVRLFRERLRAAEHVKRDDWADYMPSLSLTAQPFYQDPATTSVPQWGFQGVALLSWNLYDGGLRYGLAKERAAVVREAKASVEGGVRQAQADVRAADEELRRSAASLAAARDAAKLATESLQLTNLAYRAGASTNIEVIDAERRARDADTVVTQAEDAWRQATLDLLLANGRFPAR
jgi:outer membrane protein TolC